MVESLAFIIHSPFPCPAERCSVCLRVNCILIEIKLVWLYYKSDHCTPDDTKSTEYFIGLVPLVAWEVIPPVPVPWRILQRVLGYMSGCLCLLTGVFRTGDTSVLMHTCNFVGWASKH